MLTFIWIYTVYSLSLMKKRHLPLSPLLKCK